MAEIVFPLQYSHKGFGRSLVISNIFWSYLLLLLTPPDSLLFSIHPSLCLLYFLFCFSFKSSFCCSCSAASHQSVVHLLETFSESWFSIFQKQSVRGGTSSPPPFFLWDLVWFIFIFCHNSCVSKYISPLLCSEENVFLC